MKRSVILLAALTALLANACRGLDASQEELRQRTLAQYHIVIDDDGCDMTAYPGKLPLTRENIYAQMLDAVKGSEVDTVSFCPFCVGHRLATRSKVTDVHTLGDPTGQCRNLTAELIAMGTDPLQVAVDFCRENNLKVWANFRVNDIHDATNKLWMYGIKVAHPEQLVGDEKHKPPYGYWSAFDFARPEVRARVRAICNELLSNYDVDGLELDFNRAPIFFKSVAWGGSASEQEVADMTQMLRDIRADADRIGRARGRHLVVAARVPDSAPVARDAGLDIETWMRDRLIDIFIAGGDHGYYNSYAGAVALGHKYGAKVFSSVDFSWMRGVRNSIPCYTAQCAAALNAGADGLFFFNMLYGSRKAFIPLMRHRLDDLRLMDKTYYGYYQSVENFTNISRKTAQLDELGWRRGDRLYLAHGGGSARMEIEMGDDFTRPEVLAKNPKLTLKVETRVKERYNISAKVNGHALGKFGFGSGDYFFDVPLTFVRPGANLIEFSGDESLADTLPLRTILKGDVLLQGPQQAPWRRLWIIHDFANAEKIVDGAYRLADSGTAENTCANLLYPIVPIVPGQDTCVCEFELRVESTTAPDAVAFRIANGKRVEMLCFEPDAISLKFQGGRFPCKTDDAFHRYRVEAAGEILRIYMDGNKLAEVKMTMGADDEAARLTGTHSVIEHMNDSSIALGSFSGPGRSVSCWRNVALGFPYVQLHDVSLRLVFPQE